MLKVKIACKVNDGHTPSEARSATATVFIVFQEIECHLIFYVKIDFKWKAQFVVGGHTTETP